MVVSDRVVRALEFFPILLALSTLSAPIMLMSSSAHLTIRGVNACFYSAAPPIKFPESPLQTTSCIGVIFLSVRNKWTLL